MDFIQAGRQAGRRESLTMFGTDKMVPAAAAVGLVVLAALMGCGGEPSVASKSAAAFRESQKKGETFEGSGHSHGRGAATPGGQQALSEAAPGADAGNDEHATHEAGHGSAEESAADHSAMGHGADHQAAGHAPGRSGSSAQGTAQGNHGNHSAHGGMAHGQSPAAPSRDVGHAGHGAAPSAAPVAPEVHNHGAHGAQGSAPQPPSSGAGHAGHSAAPEVVPDAPAPAVEVPSPGQPASTLRPNALDAPATTSVTDAQRSADMAEGMAGGHGGHGGTGTYRHVDAGRGPGAHEASEEPQSSDADAHQHGEHPAEVEECHH